MDKPLPPRRFNPVGPIDLVRFSSTPPPFVKAKKKRGRRAEGLRYEARVHEYLLDLYEGHYIPSPWFRFREVGKNRERWCQPDGLIISPLEGKITIVECKLQHTTDAWWQLKWLYLPIVMSAFPPRLWKYSVCEVCKWYDPAIPFPEKVTMTPFIDAVRGDEFGVHIWRP